MIYLFYLFNVAHKLQWQWCQGYKKALTLTGTDKNNLT